ncbi:class II aaRS and biotin synthetase [Trichocladium antarcticum]|uniref:threonine--tRNA ligase n=1 Tax=Trichocladium antarcticum TaxID=1450529 RepID=A0AAN6UGM9_9PEZI|nr:class II aaRS and biotin synthetase [Trichocladium antarcticum]
MPFLRASRRPAQILARQCRAAQRLSARPIQSRLCSSHGRPEPSPAAKDAAPDHRTLGLQQELFITSIYSPGSPIFLPNGTRIFNRLVDFLRKQYIHYGFQEVITPTIYKKALWATSGHLENYAEDMYTVTSTSPSRAEVSEAGEEAEYGLKPMNCPGHCLIFASQNRSYRDLPIRYADFSPLHRNEVSGALSGLTRVRRFHQDDGHIFCRPSQIEDEIRKTLDFIRLTYKVFGLGPYRLALSTRPAQFMGAAEDWDQAEDALRRALDEGGKEWSINAGDGAFYGPKIDVILTDSDGKEHQTGTIQLDFQLPKRFNLEYAAPAPALERKGETTTDAALLAQYGPVQPVLIHRAVLGSAERLMALLIEHYNGKWPLWLHPRQAIVLTLNDTEPVVQWANHARDVLRGVSPGSPESVPAAPTGLAVDLDDSARGLGVKAREAARKGYGLVVVVGKNDVEAGQVTVNATALAPSDASAEELKKLKRMTMKPEELREFMLSKVNAAMDLTNPSDPPPDYITAARAHGIPLRQSAPIKKGPYPLDLPILTYLRSKRVILASASPRRKALLSQLGLPNLEVLPSTEPEDLDKKTHTPEEYVAATAHRKCLAVYQTALARQSAAAAAGKPAAEDPAVVIAADTVIATRTGQILEKPRSEADHARMLRHLRDTEQHRVLTAVCVLAPKADATHPGYEMAAHVEDTRVFFARADDGLPDDVIASYVRTREGADKAGGYALQGVGGMVLVDRVEGSVDNVIGLPVRKCLQLCERVVFRQGADEEGEGESEEE